MLTTLICMKKYGLPKFLRMKILSKKLDQYIKNKN